MKHTKRIFAIFMSLAMVMTMMIAMSATAFAEGETPAPAYDKPLTVSGLSTGDTVKFYKVIEWVGNAEGNVAGWKAISPYDSVLNKDTLTQVLLGTKAVEDDPATTDVDESKPAVPAGITSELAGQLAKLATGGVDGTIDGTKATLDNDSAGMWMALVTPADANILYNPVFVSADYNKNAGGTVAMTDSYNRDAVAKKSTLKLEKSAKTAEDNWDDKKSDTTAVGDTVSFTVKTTIPGYGDVYTNPHFVMKDSLTALKLNKTSVKVTGLTEGADKDYTVEATDSGYTITFTEKYLKTLKTATDIEVTYTAIVTSDAANAVNEEDNEVSIEYSHNPNQQNDYDVKKDTTQHYTFSIDASGIGNTEIESLKGKQTSEVVKVGVDADGNPISETKTTSEIGDPTKDYVTGPLDGAVFGLFTDADGTVPYKAKKADGTEGEAVTATTGADGRMNFAGLDAGTYYLKEISAPAGYVARTTTVPVVIEAETEEVEVTEWWNGSVWVSEKPASGTAKEVTYKTNILKSYKVTIDGTLAAEYTFENDKKVSSTEIQWEKAELVEHPVPIENTKGTELPSTGGIGTVIFYTLGTLLVVGCGIVLVSRRRMQKNK